MMRKTVWNFRFKKYARRESCAQLKLSRTRVARTNFKQADHKTQTNKHKIFKEKLVSKTEAILGSGDKIACDKLISG